MKNHSLRTGLLKAAKQADPRAVGWHTLRHTFAGHLVMRGAVLKSVQELLGHASREMTMRYTPNLSPHVAREAVALLERPSRGTSGAHGAG